MRTFYMIAVLFLILTSCRRLVIEEGVHQICTHTIHGGQIQFNTDTVRQTVYDLIRGPYVEFYEELKGRKMGFYVAEQENWDCKKLSGRVNDGI